MILVRNVFQMKFGKAKEVKAIMLEAVEINRKNGMTNLRVLTDITGPAYTMVFEIAFDSLAEFEKKVQVIFSAPEWREMYNKLTPLMESSCREIYTIEV